ncbi:MAG TPA: KTSC domain-containing protein [Nitrospiraceae bacterium]|nr:KTSC domain-containing protein [Nitrospiraceae bacterium]
MIRKPVDSSNINSVGFDKGPPAVLEIGFIGGGIYQYTSEDDKIVKNHHDQLMLANSKGKYFNDHIRRDPAIKTQKVG